MGHIKMSKGVVTTLEVIAVVSALFVSFSIFFPGISYSDNWSDAYAVLASRDITASLVAGGSE